MSAGSVCRDPDFVLSGAPTHKRLKDDDYAAALARTQHDLRTLQLGIMCQNARAIVVFEGWDASGKGGTIRRMASVLEPREAAFWSIGPPGPVWDGRHYLERFWPCLPAPGRMSVFDRSWYGRVLVERVEELAARDAWARAYDEINSFERMLRDDGILLVKLFLHISPQEQLRRFQKRLDDPGKRWKITLSDIRNWEQREAYADAIQDMIRRTSTERAPWHVIPADNKPYARVTALRTVYETLADDLGVSVPGMDRATAVAARDRLGLKLPKDLAKNLGGDLT